MTKTLKSINKFERDSDERHLVGSPTGAPGELHDWPFSLDDSSFHLRTYPLSFRHVCDVRCAISSCTCRSHAPSIVRFVIRHDPFLTIACRIPIHQQCCVCHRLVMTGQQFYMAKTVPFMNVKVLAFETS